MSKDTNFDQHKTRFNSNIYNTAKGQIRLQLVLDDLLKNVAILNEGRQLDILDAGCGMGQVALKLAARGHNLTLCDISSEMLSLAKDAFQVSNHKADFHHSSVQDLAGDKKYDLIIFHAVLEWLDKPEEIIPELKNRLKEGGYISLMFYNINSIIFYNLLKGNFRKVLSQDFKGHPGGLTPTNPIEPDELDRWLINNQITVLKKTGIRVFYDYLNKDLKAKRTIEDIIEMEAIYSQKPPFNMMGRYIHYICQTA